MENTYVYKMIILVFKKFPAWIIVVFLNLCDMHVSQTLNNIAIIKIAIKLFH